GDIRKLGRCLIATVLDHQQPRSDNFQNETPCRNRTCDAPSREVSVVGPYADVGPWPFYSRSQTSEQICIEPNVRVELQWPETLLGRQERNRNLRSVTLFAT